MFVRVSRYRVLPDQLDRYLAIQEQAGQVYRNYELIRTSYFQSTADPCVWLEVHWYPDQETCERITAEMASIERVAELWNEFQSTLDPAFQADVEEYQSPARPH